MTFSDHTFPQSEPQHADDVEPSAPAAPASPTERVERLIDLTGRLNALLEKENEILARRRPREMAPFQAEKSKLAAAYAREIRAVAKDRDQYNRAGAGLVERLKEITQDFEARTRRQKALLDGARQASEGLVKAVAAEAARSDPQNRAYGASGGAAARPTNNPGAGGLSINQRV